MGKMKVEIEEKYFENLDMLADRMYEMQDIISKNENKEDRVNYLIAFLEECVKIQSGIGVDELVGPIFTIINNIAIEIKNLRKNEQKLMKDKFFKLLEGYNDYLHIFNEKGEVTGWY